MLCTTRSAVAVRRLQRRGPCADCTAAPRPSGSSPVSWRTTGQPRKTSSTSHAAHLPLAPSGRTTQPLAVTPRNHRRGASLGAVGRVTARRPVLRVGRRRPGRAARHARRSRSRWRSGSGAARSPSRCGPRATTWSWPPGSSSARAWSAAGDQLSAHALLRRSVDDEGVQHLQRPRRRPRPRPPAPPDPSLERSFYTTSSCGRVRQGVARRGAQQRSVRRSRTTREVTAAAVLTGLPDRLRDGQQVFDKTGGLHAAGLFTADGDLLVPARGRRPAQRRRQGRRLGAARGPAAAARHGAARQRPGVVRADAEGLDGRPPVLAAVSAPSSLAVDLAAEAGMTLVGFLRGPTHERLRAHATGWPAG